MIADRLRQTNTSFATHDRRLCGCHLYLRCVGRMEDSRTIDNNGSLAPSLDVPEGFCAVPAKPGLRPFFVDTRMSW